MRGEIGEDVITQYAGAIFLSKLISATCRQSTPSGGFETFTGPVLMDRTEKP